MDVLHWLIGDNTYDNHDVDIEALKTISNAGKAVMVNPTGDGITTSQGEEWTFTLENGTTITRRVVITNA